MVDELVVDCVECGRSDIQNREDVMIAVDFAAGESRSFTPNETSMRGLDFSPCAPGCNGWLHMDDPYEIEACDECARFSGDDREEQARAAHKKECGCAWPDFDYQHAAMAWMYDIDEYYDSTDLLQGSNANVLRNFIETNGQELMDNVIPIIFLCTQMIDREKGDTKCKKAIGGMLTMMKEIRDKIAAKELTLKDFEIHDFDWKEGNTKDDFDSPTDRL